MDLGELDTLSVLAGLATAGFVLAVWAIGMLLWLRRRAALRGQITRRLEGDEIEVARTLRLWHDGEEATTVVPELHAAPSLRERIERLHRSIGLTSPLRATLLMIGATAVGVGIASYVLSAKVAPGLLGVAAVALIAWWYLSRRIVRRAGLFERQLVDGLELSARALRAGHPLSGAFELIAEEIPAPVGTMFREICQQQAMGVRLEDALRRAARISDSADMHLFSAALAIQVRAGGNLAEMMQGLAFVIRERMRLNRRFKVLIAQTQFSKRVLMVMPLALFALLTLINGEYIAVLYTSELGNMMLAMAVGSLLVGWLVMNRMSSLRQ